MKKLLSDLRNLDTKNIGGWSASVKGFFIALVFIFVVVLGWQLHIRNQQDNLQELVRKEAWFKREFARKQAEAVNLPALERQLLQMKDMLARLLRELPSKTEMPKLLIDISQTALAAGLQVELFKPAQEVPKEFYAEKPIRIKMIGSYHQFGTFISGVASLPRVVIMTMHDVSLTPLRVAAEHANPRPGEKLILQGTVKTYHYLDDSAEGTGSVAGKGRTGRRE